MAKTRYIVGLGTGRCGTSSLSALLGLQHGVLCEHERRPILSWNGERVPNRHLAPHHGVTVADVGFYYLPHVPYLANLYGNAIRFVCMRRPREAVVASFLKHGDPAWFAGDDGEWQRAFPNYPGRSFQEAVAAYWDHYEHVSQQYQRTIRQFRVFDIEALNSTGGVAAILAHLEIDRPVIKAGVHIRDGETVATYIHSQPQEVLSHG